MRKQSEVRRSGYSSAPANSEGAPAEDWSDEQIT